MVMAEFVIVVSRIVIAKIEVLGFVQATGEARNGLGTVTYLYEGEFEHRDSLGTHHLSVYRKAAETTTAEQENAPNGTRMDNR